MEDNNLSRGQLGKVLYQITKDYFKDFSISKMLQIEKALRYVLGLLVFTYIGTGLVYTVIWYVNYSIKRGLI